MLKMLLVVLCRLDIYHALNFKALLSYDLSFPSIVSPAGQTVHGQLYLFLSIVSPSGQNLNPETEPTGRLLADSEGVPVCRSACYAPAIWRLPR
jgi:hypothetical protein